MSLEQSDKTCKFAWRRDGAGWLLLHGRRRFGRVVPDAKHPGMWRSLKLQGRRSESANLSWAKNAVLVAAERELDFERRAIVPSECQEKRGVFSRPSSLVRQNELGARRGRSHAQARHRIHEWLSFWISQPVAEAECQAESTAGAELARADRDCRMVEKPRRPIDPSATHRIRRPASDRRAQLVHGHRRRIETGQRFCSKYSAPAASSFRDRQGSE
jgi:hypothetical protein